jgi:hypothetical protein
MGREPQASIVNPTGMKKFFFSLGMAAAGTASLHASDLWTLQDNKDWNVSATLRGFYDDNIYTAPKKTGSYGFEVTPTLEFEKPFQQTELGLRYTYDLNYFQARENAGQKPIDQAHQFDLWLDHAFTPRMELQFDDTVRVSQEPAIAEGPTVVVRRVEGNNLQNTANLALRTDWTKLFSTELTYQNTYVNYNNSGGTALQPSYAGLLDRVEQNFGLEGLWKITQKTTAIAEYDFGLINYVGNEPIAPKLTPPFYYTSSAKDSMQHSVTVGLDHQFLENLSGHADVGVEYADYYNDPSSTSAWGPRADLNLHYVYSPGAFAEIGFQETRSAVDTAAVDSKGQITQDQEVSVLYMSINHPLTPKLLGSLVGHYQHGIYHGGSLDGQSGDFYYLGFNFDYKFTQHFSGNAGYHFTYYTSAEGGDYTRNVIYLGVTASY